MLTRAYDAIMAAYQVPAITNQNVDFNTSAIDDSVLNCKDFAGNIKTILPPAIFNGNSFSTPNHYAYYLPFACWTTSDYSTLHPDENGSEPTYEEYSVANGTPSGWTVSSSYPSFTKTYDANTKEFVCSVTILWQNTGGVAKTVYGIKVRGRGRTRNSYSDTSGSTGWFLVCREHFASPVVVEDQGIIALTFTWRVGRAGLVSATAAAAE